MPGLLSLTLLFNFFFLLRSHLSIQCFEYFYLLSHLLSFAFKSTENDLVPVE